MTARRVADVVAYALISLIVVVPFAFWLHARLSSVDRGAFLRRNDAILARLPPYAGARTFHRDDEPLGSGSLTPTTAYSTQVEYRLGHRVPRGPIVTWYRDHLRSWRERSEGELDTWSQGRATVALAVTLGPSTDYEVFVQAAGG
jgi:hypothetical protein